MTRNSWNKEIKLKYRSWHGMFVKIVKFHRSTWLCMAMCICAYRGNKNIWWNASFCDVTPESSWSSCNVELTESAVWAKMTILCSFLSQNCGICCAFWLSLSQVWPRDRARLLSVKILHFQSCRCADLINVGHFLYPSQFLTGRWYYVNL